MAVRYPWPISKGKSSWSISGGRGARSVLPRAHALNALAQKYHRQGFVILGVNLHAKHPDDKDSTTALPTARQLLAKDGVTLVNLLDCQRTVSVTTAYGVEDIPANFLIGRDGRVVAVEQRGDALERAIVRALGGLSGGDFK